LQIRKHLATSAVGEAPQEPLILHPIELLDRSILGQGLES